MKMGKRFNRLAISAGIFILLVAGCDRKTDPVIPTSLTGVYSCQESSAHSGIRKYFAERANVKDTDDLYIISNFHDKGESEFLFAELKQDTLSIINQSITEIRVEGKGPVGKDFRSVNLYYETDDGITILDYYALYTR